MEIRKSTLRDTDALMSLFDEARGTIALLGIDQWQNGYPSREVVGEDIVLERSYAVDVDGHVRGTFVLIEDGEPTYDRIYDGEWKTGNENANYLAIHRVAVSVAMRGKGISTAIVDYAETHARALGRVSLRIDTHEGNVVMRRMLEKHGFVYCGVIYLENGDPRVAYEKILICDEMSDIKRAKKMLSQGGYTCVLCRGEESLTFTLRGVRPLVELLQSGRDCRGYSAADKVVGRATAFLYVLLGVRCVFAKVISRAALSVLEAAGVCVEFETLTDNIINRAGDGICPFEAAVLDIDNAETAYSAILAKMKAMGID